MRVCGMSQIWWCEKHKSQQFDEESCWLRRAVQERLEPPCVMVEKQLVPLNAIVISGEELRMWELANRGTA